jgi:hypothetical protein
LLLQFQNITAKPEWKSTLNTVIEISVTYLQGLKKI